MKENQKTSTYLELLYERTAPDKRYLELETDVV